MPEVAEQPAPREAARSKQPADLRTTPWVVAFVTAVVAGVLAAAWGINSSQDRRSRADASAGAPVRPVPSDRGRR